MRTIVEQLPRGRLAESRNSRKTVSVSSSQLDIDAFQFERGEDAQRSANPLKAFALFLLSLNPMVSFSSWSAGRIIAANNPACAACKPVRSSSKPAFRTRQDDNSGRSAASDVTSSLAQIDGEAPSRPVYEFQDGSSYCGDVVNGRMTGHGEWRSADGSSYVGDFVDDVFEGHGKYTDARGNCYVGSFKASAMHGAGTYLYSDGRAEVGSYSNGVEVGEGARWSPDRFLAWRLKDGQVADAIKLSEAAAIAGSLSLPVPPSIFQLDASGQARLAERLVELDLQGGQGGDGEFAWKGAMEAATFDDNHKGFLVAQSTRPLIPNAACDAVVAEAEARAEALGGWTSTRHTNYPTTDVPLQNLPLAHRLFTERILPDVAYPFLAAAFGPFLPNTSSRRADAVEARQAFRVNECFVVKYNATSGQRELKPHRDGSVVSFNIALNDMHEYEGGGTMFEALAHHGNRELGDTSDQKASEGSSRVATADASGVLLLPKGHIIAHASALTHGGHPITAGVRYILVAFVTIDPAYLIWAQRFGDHVQHIDDELRAGPRA